MAPIRASVSWKMHITNEELYKNLPKVSQTINEQRGLRRRGRQAVTYVDYLKSITGLDDANDLRTAMLNRDEWRNHIKLGRAGARPR